MKQATASIVITNNICFVKNQISVLLEILECCTGFSLPVLEILECRTECEYIAAYVMEWNLTIHVYYCIHP